MSLLDLIIPAVAMGGGYLLKQNAEKKAEKKRAAVLNNMQTLNTDATKKNIASITDTMQMVTPEVRMPAYEQAAQKNVASLTADVMAPPEIPIGPQYGGKVSDAFSTATARRAADDLKYSTTLARLMGRAAAPADLALDEREQNVEGALDRDKNNLLARHGLNNEQLKLSAITPNGGQMMAGDMMMMGGIAAGTQEADPLGEMQRAYAKYGLNANGDRPLPPTTVAAAGKPGTTSYWTNGRKP